MLPIGTKIKCTKVTDNTYWIDTIVGYTGTTHRYILKEGPNINKDLKLEGLDIDNFTYIIAICKVYKPFKRYKRRYKRK